MIRLLTLLSFVALAFTWTACSSQKLAFSKLSESGTSYMGEEQEVLKLITNQAELDALVKTHQLQAMGQLEGADLKNYNMIFVSAGMRNSGGYSIEVQNVESKSGDVKIEYLEKEPGSNCLVTDAITYPFALIMLKKSEKVENMSALRTAEKVNCEE